MNGRPGDNGSPRLRIAVPTTTNSAVCPRVPKPWTSRRTPDDAVSAKVCGLLLHAVHRQLARVIQRAREHLELVALAKLLTLVADVVDRGAQHQPERFVASIFNQQVFVDRQIGGKQSGLVELKTRPS